MFNMARHLVAVCVVCLLCAEHFPCKGHIEGRENYQENLIKYSKDSRTAHLTSFDYDQYHDKERNKVNDFSDDRDSVRLKRHSHTHHNSEQNSMMNSNLKIGSSSKDFIEKLFKMYGDSETQTMNLVNFENMLDKLGLKNLIASRLSIANGQIVDGTTIDVKNTKDSNVSIIS